jgi:hypothetical protein
MRGFLCNHIFLPVRDSIAEFANQMCWCVLLSSIDGTEAENADNEDDIACLAIIS